MNQNIIKSGFNLTTTSQVIYTVPNDKVAIAKLFLSNTNGINDVKITITVNDIYIAKDTLIYANESQLITNPIHLTSGDQINAYANNTNSGMVYVSGIEYLGSAINSTLNAGLNNVPVVPTQIYQCPVNYNAIVRIMLTNIGLTDIFYSVNIIDGITSEIFYIAKDIPLALGTSEMFDVGINMKTGDILQVKSGTSNSLSVFASIALLNN